MMTSRGGFYKYTRGERVKERASSGEHITSEAGKAGEAIKCSKSQIYDWALVRWIGVSAVFPVF